MPIYNPFRKPKPTAAYKHFVEQRPIASKAVQFPMPTEKYPLAMHRLSFGALTAKEDMAISELHWLLTSGWLAADFIFPDTGFVTTSIDRRFWKFNPSSMIVFPEIIKAELSGWLGNPIHNKELHGWLSRSLQRLPSDGEDVSPLWHTTCLASIDAQLERVRIGVLKHAENSHYAYQHYVNLLSIRKRLGVRCARELESKLGREPTETELRNFLGRECGPRTAPIAFKGWQDQGKRNYLADEELVVSGVMHAIATGGTTVILTRDNDVFDQFLTLVETLYSDYSAYRFALLKHHCPEAFPMQKRFVGGDDVERSPLRDAGIRSGEVEHIAISLDDAENLPPSEPHLVHAFCVLAGNSNYDPKISVAGVCLEEEMFDLLITKAISGGRNTKHFGDRNVLIGTHLASELPLSFFMLAEEVKTEFEGVSVWPGDLRQMLSKKSLTIEKTF